MLATVEPNVPVPTVIAAVAYELNTLAEDDEVNAETPTKPPDDNAPKVEDVIPVTRPNVVVDCALAPYHETVHVLLA